MHQITESNINTSIDDEHTIADSNLLSRRKRNVEPRAEPVREREHWCQTRSCAETY
jgi:hypothetical protein